MARGDVTFKFDAETAEFVSKVLDARQKMDALADNTRKFGDAAGAATDKASKGFGQLSAAGEGVLLTLTGIGGALATLKNAWDDAFSEMEKRAKNLIGSVQTLQDALAHQGRAQMLPQIRKELAEDSKGRVDRKDAERIYSGIAAQVGDRLDPAGMRAAYRTAMHGIDAGMNADSATQLAKTFGELKASGIKGVNDAGLQELAFEVNKVAPQGLDDRMLRTINRSSNPLTAFNAVVTGLRTKEGAKALESLMQEADMPADAEHLRSGSASDRRRIQALGQVAPDDRFTYLLQHPEIASDNNRRAISNLAGSYQDYAGRAFAGGPGSFADQRLQAQKLAMNDPATRAAMLKRQTDLEAEELDEGTPQDVIAAAQFQANVNQYRRNGSSKWAATTYGYIDYAIGGAGQALGVDNGSGTQLQAAGINAQAARDDAGSKAIVDAIKDLKSTVSNLNVKNNDPALRSDKAGAK